MRDTARFNPVFTGVITILVCFAMIAAVIVSGLPGGPPIPGLPRGMQVKVALTDADALAPHSSVQIAGVKIGEIENVDLAKDNTAIVTMAIEPQYADIHADAIARLRPHGLFGPKFIDLDPGNASAPKLHDGDTIPGRQTVQPVDLDQVLQELQKNEKVNLQTAIVELGKAAAGRGDDVNHLFAAAKSVTEVLDHPVRALDNVAPNLSNYFVQTEAFNAAYSQAPLDQLLDSSNRALTQLANNSDHLKSILTHANTTLDNLDQALAGHVQDLRTTIEQLPPVMDKLNRFNDLLSVFGANFTGKEPGVTDATPGIIAAIENIRSAFSSSNPCTAGVGNCPSDGRSHYVRVQVFNLSPIGNPIAVVCTGANGIPGLGAILQQTGAGTCQASAPATAAPATLAGSVTGATAGSPAVLGNLLTP